MGVPIIVVASKRLRIEGETTPEFSAQWKRLTPQDKIDIGKMLLAEGEDVAIPEEVKTT